MFIVNSLTWLFLPDTQWKQLETALPTQRPDLCVIYSQYGRCMTYFDRLKDSMNNILQVGKIEKDWLK